MTADPALELRLHRLTGAFLAGYRKADTRTASGSGRPKEFID